VVVVDTVVVVVGTVVVVVVVVVVDVVVVVSFDDEHDAMTNVAAAIIRILDAMATDSIRFARLRCRNATLRSRHPPSTESR